MKQYQVALPCLGEEEALAAGEVIRSGWVTQGPKVQEFENNFASTVGAAHGCAVTNCTVALTLALRAIGVSSGDIVITVSHSFIATANAVRHCGAEPYFVDIDSKTLNMSPAELEKVISQKFKSDDGSLWLKDCSMFEVEDSPLHRVKYPKGRLAAIIPVHQLGMPANLASILSVADKYNVPVIEDAACAAGSKISIDGGKSWEYIGAPHGVAACFSFHPRKVLTTGDGGMITTNSKKIAGELRLLRQHGMEVSDVARHSSRQVIFENYVTTAYNGRLTDIQAAVGIQQVKRLDGLVAHRRELAKAYAEGLSNLSGVHAPFEPEYARSNWQSYAMHIDDFSRQKELMQSLLDKGIATRRGVINAHLEKPYQECWKGMSLPNSEQAQQTGIILPLHHMMTTSDCHEICSQIAVLL